MLDRRRRTGEKGGVGEIRVEDLARPSKREKILFVAFPRRRRRRSDYKKET